MSDNKPETPEVRGESRPVTMVYADLLFLQIAHLEKKLEEMTLAMETAVSAAKSFEARAEKAERERDAVFRLYEGDEATLALVREAGVLGYTAPLPRRWAKQLDKDERERDEARGEPCGKCRKCLLREVETLRAALHALIENPAPLRMDTIQEAEKLRAHVEAEKFAYDLLHGAGGGK